jgi:hypothetical protein
MELVDIIVKKCAANKQSVLTSYFFFNSFPKSAVLTVIFGGYLGIILDAKYFKITKSNMNNTHKGISLLRCIVVLLITGIIMSPNYYFISSNKGTWFQYIFKYQLPYFLEAFICFSVLNLLLVKLRLIN